MKNLWLIIWLFPFISFAQEFEISDTVFLDKDWNATSYRANAMYYRGMIFNPADSTWLVHDFYLDNDTLQMIGLYKNEISSNNQVGEFRYYYRNGNLRAIYFYKNGKFDGYAKRFYENGNQQAVEFYRSGVLSDTTTLFYESGLPQEIKVVNPDHDAENLAENEKQFKLIAYWDQQGIQQVVNGNGTKIEYYPDGRKRVSIDYSGGYPHGEWIQYGNKRKVKSRMTFKNGAFISGVIYNKRKKDIIAMLFREPRFPGGAQGLDDFVKKNTNKCREGFNNEVMLLITVTETGEARFEQVLSGDVSHCQFEELQALVNHMPKWTPAVRYANYVESTYVIRVRY